MAEVSLSEINSFRPDSQEAKGEPAVLYDISAALKGANEAAHEKAQYDWLKYQNHLKQVSQYAQNHQLDFAGVMPEDVSELQKQANVYFEKIRKDPRLVTQMGEDPDWVKLQGSIAKSKQDNSLLTLQEDFRQKNPDLLNDKNNQIALAYRGAGLSRNANQLQWDLPKTIDFTKLATEALKNSGSNYSSSGQQFLPKKNEKGEPIIDPKTGKPEQYYTGKLIQEEGTQYNPTKFGQQWNDLLNSNITSDRYGHTLKQSAQDTFNNLAPQQKQYFSDKAKANNTTPLDQWWKDTGNAYFKDKDVNKTTLADDKLFDMGEKHKDDLELEEAKARHQRNLEYLRLNFGEKKEKEAGEGLLKVTADIITGSKQVGDIGGNLPHVLDTKDNSIALQIAPQMRQVLGVTRDKKVNSLDSNGKVISSVDSKTLLPDVVSYNPKTKQVDIIFYKKGPDNETEIEKTDPHKLGEPVVDDKVSSSIGMRQFITKVAQGSGITGAKASEAIDEAIKQLDHNFKGDIEGVYGQASPKEASKTENNSKPQASKYGL